MMKIMRYVPVLTYMSPGASLDKCRCQPPPLIFVLLPAFGTRFFAWDGSLWLGGPSEIDGGIHNSEGRGIRATSSWWGQGHSCHLLNFPSNEGEIRVLWRRFWGEQWIVLLGLLSLFFGCLGATNCGLGFRVVGATFSLSENSFSVCVCGRGVLCSPKGEHKYLKKLKIN